MEKAAALTALIARAQQKQQPQQPQHNNLGEHFLWLNHTDVAVQKDGYHGLQAPSDDSWEHRLWHSGELVWGESELCYNTDVFCEEDAAFETAGPSVIATTHRTITQTGKQCLTEVRKLIYTTGQRPTPAARPTRQAPSPLAKFVFSTQDIAEYSRLTSNGHLIHIDPYYAQTFEGYPDVLVQGPLLVTALLRCVAEPIRSCSYRMLAPCFPGETLSVSRGKHNRYSMFGPDGSLRLTCTVTRVEVEA